LLSRYARRGARELMGRLLTIEEAAERLRISKHTLYNWLQNRKNCITDYAFKIGERKWVFEEEDLEKFIKSQKSASRCKNKN
jgi:excisionase family DNA binding protein